MIGGPPSFGGVYDEENVQCRVGFAGSADCADQSCRGGSAAHSIGGRITGLFDQAYPNEEQAILYPVFSTDAVFHITLGATSFALTNFQDWITNGWPSLEVASGITGHPVLLVAFRL